MNVTAARASVVEVRIRFLACLRAATALALVLAVAGKILTPVSSAMLLSSTTRAAGIEASSPALHLSGAIALDLVLLACLFLRGSHVGALGCMVIGVIFLAARVLAAAGGAADGCGCFGTALGIPDWVAPAVSLALVYIGWSDLCRAMAGPFRKWSLARAAAAAGGLAAALVAMEPAAERWISEGTGIPVSEHLAARDKFVYVFSPDCPDCVASARRLRHRAEAGHLVGVTSPGLGSVDAFFARIGFSFPVEHLTAGAWYALLYPAPPGYYRIDSAGGLKRIPSEVMFGPGP